MSRINALNNPGTQGRIATIALRVVQIVLAIDFIVGGILKLAGVESMVDLFARIGGGQWLRYLVGALELSGGIGVLIPPLTGLAAVGLTALLTAATFTNLFIVNDPPWAPLFWLVVAAFVAWRRWPQSKAFLTGFMPRRADLR